MATITSAAAGDFHAGATWKGGVVPSTGDAAVLEHALTTTADVSVASILIGAGSLAVATPLAIRMTGDLSGLTAAGVSNGAGIVFSHTSGIGLVQCANAIHTGAVTLVAGTSSGQVRVECSGVAELGASSAGLGTMFLVSGAGAPFTIAAPGGLRGGSARNRYALLITGSASSVTVEGDVVAGTDEPMIRLSATANLLVTGKVDGSAATAATRQPILVVAAAAGSAVTIRGEVIASDTTTAVSSTGVVAAVRAESGITALGAARAIDTGGSLVIGGHMASSALGVLPFRSATVKAVDNSSLTWRLPTILSTGDALLSNRGDDMPAPNNVRAGVVYGPADNTAVGTMEVPDTSQVAAGVPVGTTVGTAVCTAEAVGRVVGAQIAAALA